MTITAATLDSTGCFLSITGTWARSIGFQADGSATAGSPAAAPFTDYALTPNGTPTLKLNVARPGFIRSGGTAVAASRPKVILGSHPKRTAVMYDPPSGRLTSSGYDALSVPANIALDEVDNGTTRTVKIVLSQPVYASDTAVTMDVLAGWRIGEATATGITVDTSSVTAVHPLVIARPAVAPLQVITGAFWFDPVIAAHYPESFQAIAAVKYTLTDGTNTTAPVWVTAATASPLYGDNFKTWGASLDPTGLYPGGSGLTAGGVINVNFDVYPWTGLIRSFSTATPSVALAISTVCQRGTPMIYNPGKTRIPDAFVVIDPINGTLSASATPVKTTLTGVGGAQQVAAASKPKDLSTAIACIRSFARTTGANINSADGATVVIPDSTAIPFDSTGPVGSAPNGATAIGTAGVGSGLTNVETWLNIVGDPTLTAAQARTRCQINGQTTIAVLRAGKLHYQNLTIHANTVEILNAQCWADNVTVDGALNSASASSPFKAAGTYAGVGTGTAPFFATNTSYLGTATGIWKNTNPMLVRNHQGDKGYGAIALIGASCPPATGVAGLIANVTNSLDPDASFDNIRYNVDCRNGGGQIPIPFFNAGTRLQQTRLAHINVLAESVVGNLTIIGSTDTPLITAAGCTGIDTTDCIWEGVSLIGDRSIFLYDEPPLNTANITASIASNVLTVTAISSSSGTGGYGVVKVGSTIAFAGSANYAVVTSLGTATVGTGTYNLTACADVASRAMFAVALNDIATLTNTATGVILRNVYQDKFFTKTDVYGAPTVALARTNANGGTALSGYAKARTGSHSFLFGVNQFNVVDGWRFQGGAVAGGSQEDRGLNFKLNPNNNSAGGNLAICLTWPKFTDDRSWFGTQAGFGDYKPAIGSPLLSMCTDANTDQDLRGVTRAALFSTGAIEGPAAIIAAFAFRRSGFVGGGVRVGL